MKRALLYLGYDVDHICNVRAADRLCCSRVTVAPRVDV